MKAVIRKSDQLSVFVFDDNESLSFSENSLVTSRFVAVDISEQDYEIVSVANKPEDWTGGKYFWKNNAWELDPDWVDPATLEEELTAPPEAR